MKWISELVPPSEQLEVNQLDSEVSAVTDRATEVGAQGLFFAIRGSQADGHSFVADALARGAVAAVVEHDVDGIPSDKLIKVPNTRSAFAHASARWFDEPSSKIPVVGVTGTNGKTTTTYLFHQVWSAIGRNPGLIGTIETRIGSQILPSGLTTPPAYELQSLFSKMVSAGVSNVAMEVSSIALDQKRTLGTKFSSAVFTNLTQDHLDYHGDWETYFRSKLRLYTEHEVANGVFNTDSEWGKRALSESGMSRAFSFGLLDPMADFFVERAQLDREMTEAVVRTPIGKLTLRLHLFGRHNLANAVGVLATSYAEGLDLVLVADALSRAEGAPGRLQRVAPLAGRPNVFVDYAHSPDALENVLRTLSETQSKSGGKLITVFGCGGDRDRAKRPLMGEVASRFSDVTVATSDNPRTEDPEFILDEIEPGVDLAGTQYFRESDRKRAIELALQVAGADDFVLVAGKGHEDYQIIGKQKFPFDDVRVIQDYYDRNTAGTVACTLGSDLAT